MRRRECRSAYIAKTTRARAASRTAALRICVGQRRVDGTINAIRPANTSGVCVSASHPPYLGRWSAHWRLRRVAGAPYPDASGEPKSVWLIHAIARHAGTTPAAKAMRREGDAARDCAVATGSTRREPLQAERGSAE